MEGTECPHYKRHCSMICPVCAEAWRCRLCHDAAVTSHPLDRFAVTRLRCDACGLTQDKAAACGGCEAQFGEYACVVCCLFDDSPKGQFHCAGCGLCRVGGRENFTHCDVCGLCLAATGFETHKCIAAASDRDCPVCLEHLHASLVPIFTPPCQHLMHMPCYNDMAKRGRYACPVCGKSMSDMTNTWRAIDHAIASTPMPAAYRGVCCQVLCKDCNEESITRFHVEGLRCRLCGSYNTARAGAGFLRRRYDALFVPTPAENPSTPAVNPRTPAENPPTAVEENPTAEPKKAAEELHLYEAVDLEELDAANEQAAAGGDPSNSDDSWESAEERSDVEEE